MRLSALCDIQNANHVAFLIKNGKVTKAVDDLEGETTKSGSYGSSICDIARWVEVKRTNHRAKCINRIVHL